MSLQLVHDAIQSFHLPITLPVIDTAPPDNDDPLPGLRFLRDEVKRDCDFLRQNANASTNAPYLIAVWDELVHARQPIAIYRTFSPADKTRPVKVDVVAENGARWVRVNTIKNARLLMEFREIDSYLTSDEEEESRPRLAQTEFDNSVLKMGRALLAAAKANPISIPSPSSNLPMTVIPQVTLRLTRLDPFQDDTPDPRIAKTIQCLRDMGIDVQLGQWPLHPTPMPKTPPTRKRLQPTANINLDLSALIALVSDISHSPLPRTEQEAHARFQPSEGYLDRKRERVKALARQSRRTHHSLDGVHDSEGEGSEEGTWENSHQHSRALAAQAMQEMHKGTLREIGEQTSAVSTPVTFWTTREARQRCLQIAAKIGGVRERQRVDALLSSTLSTRILPVPAPTDATTAGSDDDRGGNASSADAYWEHSRYPADFLPLVPVHVYPSVLPAMEDASQELRTAFFDALAQTCARILSHEAVSMSESSVPTAADVLEEIPPAAQTSLPKLTVHTVTSMLAGAARGHTTLTTNRSSVKAVLKEMRKPRGRAGWDGPDAMDEVDKAALWILDPRSLSEGMRSEQP